MVKNMRERGQAFIEYIVLIPPMLLMSVSIITLIPPTGQGAICDLDQAFNGGMCDNLVDSPDEPAPPPDTGDHDPESTATATATPTATAAPTFTPSPTPTEVEICVNWSPETGSSLCSQTEGCDELEGANVGYYMAPDIIDTFVIKAGRDYFVYNSGITEDGCYDVHITGGSVSWWRVGDGRDCKDISHLQVWQVPWCE
ncbi:MAG: hypothetical protein JXA25_03325 [Anaerolineales bacterium]|nr:hypothetical protein [Anaerolineales bacterium]